MSFRNAVDKAKQFDNRLMTISIVLVDHKSHFLMGIERLIKSREE